MQLPFMSVAERRLDLRLPNSNMLIHLMIHENHDLIPLSIIVDLFSKHMYELLQVSQVQYKISQCQHVHDEMLSMLQSVQEIIQVLILEDKSLVHHYQKSISMLVSHFKMVLYIHNHFTIRLFGVKISEQTVAKMRYFMNFLRQSMDLVHGWVM